MRAVIAVLLVAFNVSAGPYAKQANDNPFLNGELNPVYAGESTALAGKILEINTFQNSKLYKLDLSLEGIEPIWVANFIKPQGKSLELGDEVIFKGYITQSGKLDESGQLEKTINSKTLLLSIYVRNYNE